MNKGLKKFMSTSMVSILISVPLISTTTVFAYNNEQSQVSQESKSGLQIELSQEEVDELHKYFPEDTNFSDEEVDKRLIASGEFTQEELDKINAEYYANLNQSTNTLIEAKAISGVNKYKVVDNGGNGKDRLYVYISGPTLQKIKAGASLAGALGGFLPSKWLGILVVTSGWVLTENINSINTNYGIIMKYIADKWVFQANDYQYTYHGWMYQI